MRRRHFYLDPAGDGNSFVFYFIGLIAIGFGTVFFQYLLSVGMIEIPGFVPDDLKAALARNEAGAEERFFLWLESSWVRFLLVLTLFIAVIGLAVLLTVRTVHGRRMSTVLAVGGNFQWSRIVMGFAVFSAIILPLFAVDISQNAKAYTFSFDPESFALLVVMAVPLFFLQTASEEIAFRGYLGQMMGSLTTDRTLIVLVPTTLFAALHFANPEVNGQWWRLLPYFYMGLFWMLVSLRDQGIELAIGGHFANNLWISLLFTQEGTVLQTPALFRQPPLQPGMGGQVEVTGLVIASALVPALFWAATAFLPRRKARRR